MVQGNHIINDEDDIMVPMLALCVLRRTTQLELVDPLLRTCIDALEAKPGKFGEGLHMHTESSVKLISLTTSRLDGLNGACRLAVSILSIMFSRAALLSTSLRNWLQNENRIPGVMNSLMALMHADNPSASREVIAKRLVAPLLQLVDHSTKNEDVDAIVALVWQHCLQLKRGSCRKQGGGSCPTSADLETSSSLLCVCMSNPALHAMPRLGVHSTFWDMLNIFMLSSDVIVRKRGCFIMQMIPSLPLTIPPPSGTSTTTCSNSERPWWKLFLDVYGQVEGCTSFHLVEQVWPLLNKLSSLAVQEKYGRGTNEDKDSSISTGVPVISFSWVKALLHVLLAHGTSLPGIKKGALLRILSANLINTSTGTFEAADFSSLAFACDQTLVYWLCHEVLPMVDSVIYFSVQFVHAGAHVGCSEADLNTPSTCSMDGVFDEKSQFLSVSSSPGIVLPSFLARLLKVITMSATAESLAGDLIQSLVATTCGTDGLRSLSASKWILRCFAEPAVQSLLPRCLGSCEVRYIQTFLAGRLASSSGIVRAQVVEGLLPLFLVACDTQRLSLAGLVRMVAVVVDVDEVEKESPERYFSLRGVAMESRALALLRTATMDCCRHNMDFTSVDDETLAIAYSIVAIAPVAETEASIVQQLRDTCEQRLQVISRLYTSPYLEIAKQQQSIRFLRGVTAIVDLTPSLSSSPLTSLVFPLPKDLDRVAADLASYLSALITAGVHEAMLAEAVAVDGLLLPVPGHASSAATALVHSFRWLVDVSTILGALSVVSIQVLLGDGASASPHPSNVDGVFSATTRTLDSLAEILRSSATSLPTASVLGVTSCDHVLRMVFKALRAGAPVSSRIASIGGSLQRLLSVLLILREPASSRFRTLANANLHADDDRDGAPTTRRGANGLMSSIMRVTNGQYGKLSALFVGGRWSCIRLCLELLLLPQLGSSEAEAATGEGNRLLQLVLDQLEVCTMEALADILSCARIVVRRTDPQKVADVQMQTTVGQILDAAWLTAEGGASYTNVAAINAFIQFAFDAAILRCLPHEVITRHFNSVVEFGLAGRPHVMQTLTCYLCTTWTAYPELSYAFFRDGTIERLLLYRESRQDGNAGAGAGTGDDTAIVVVVGGSPSTPTSTIAGICRFAVLSFLESIMTSSSAPSPQSEELSQCLLDLASSLVALNNRKDFIAPAMIGSELYGKKLRSWQALCVMSAWLPKAELIRGDTIPILFQTLTQANGHSIRVHLELFGASVAQRFPDIIIPPIIKLLTETFNHSQQMLCSLYVILGHLALETDETSPRQALSIAAVQSIVDAVVPWLTCAQGLPRTVAQLLMVELIPRLVRAHEMADGDGNTTGDAAATTAASCPIDYLRNIYRYLTTNRDTVKIMPKQRQLFLNCNPREHCSVEGLCSMGLDNMGEVMPPHILQLVADFLKAELKAQREQDEASLYADIAADTGVSTAGGTETAVTSEAAVLQTKRIPFDDLHLGIQSELISRKQNVAGRQRQQVVVCASLIDKVANLAGIARTCEIFAVERLVMSNLKVCTTDTFQGIAVSCTEWLPMSEVPAEDLQSWLGNMRRQGYCIMGLEQTDCSVNLATVDIDTAEAFSKCVLLLGKEREGIPVELLQEIDVCLEIPQYGIVRSLNVHVSAAIAMWEITKKNKIPLALDVDV